ncbi:type II toxin-antitoxin system RelE family toxin [Desulfobacter vibrioformis]|uniref:type II toxin-antitoxin system RelE family toxin n=1 Tax=Desulfobacter vibrioformis TaxID=34031 RepID=UPI000A063F2B|nr:type II toxin-antitoxin system mRNA interferase toxin, RelE/StbE family [Desulfobacter vibrioformis]
MNLVILHRKAEKQLKKIPAYIRINFQIWVQDVESNGIGSTRTVQGYHDEPLRGQRSGQRSIRLSKTYRAIYVEHEDNIIVEVIEVNKHEY